MLYSTTCPEGKSLFEMAEGSARSWRTKIVSFITSDLLANTVDKPGGQSLFQLPGWLCPLLVHWIQRSRLAAKTPCWVLSRLPPVNPWQGGFKLAACEFSHLEILALQVSKCYLRECFLFATTLRSIFFLTSLRPLISLFA